MVDDFTDQYLFMNNNMLTYCGNVSVFLPLFHYMRKVPKKIHGVLLSHKKHSRHCFRVYSTIKETIDTAGTSRPNKTGLSEELTEVRPSDHHRKRKINVKASNTVYSNVSEIQTSQSYMTGPPRSGKEACTIIGAFFPHRNNYIF